MPIGGELQRKHRRSSQSLSFGRVTRSVTPLDEAHTIKLTSPLFFLSFCAYSQPPRHTFLLLPIGSLVPISCRSIRQCAVVYVPLPSSILIDLPLTRQTRPPVCPLCSQYFDEHGKGIKPFCNQGSRCRYAPCSPSRHVHVLTWRSAGLFTHLISNGIKAASTPKSLLIMIPNAKNPRPNQNTSQKRHRQVLYNEALVHRHSCHNLTCSGGIMGSSIESAVATAK